MILTECPKCHKKQKISTQVCACGTKLSPKCYWVRTGVNEGGVYRRKWRKLGEVTLDFAKQYELLHKARKGAATTLKAIFYDYGRWLQVSSPRWAKTAIPFLSLGLDWFGDREVDRITKREVSRFQAWLLEGRAPATVDRIHATLRAAVYRAGIEQNPFATVPLLRRNNELVRYLSAEEEAEILRLAHERYPVLYEILVVSLATGMRKDNVLKLRKEQVDLSSRTLTVVQKGGKTLTLPLAPGVVSILKTHTDCQDYYWINPTTGRPYTDFKKAWQRLKHLAGINRPFRWHDLRHHVACKMLFSGASTILIKDVLGHSDTRVTEKYAHAKPEAISTLMDLLDPIGHQNGHQNR